MAIENAIQTAAARAVRGGLDFMLDDFKLDVVGSSSLDAWPGASITAADVELSIEGASTLTVVVEDPDLTLLRSSLFTRWAWGQDDTGEEETWVRKGRAIDAFVDDFPFRLVKVSKAATTLTLTFEDREVALLRRHKGARKASRAKVTRAEFIRLLIGEVQAFGGIDLYCPELHTLQPIERSTQRLTKSQREREAHPGIAVKGSSITVKGKRATPGQVAILNRVLDVARSRKATPKATLALIMAVIQESQARNLATGDRDSQGVLQYRVGLFGVAHARDVEWSAAHFLTKGATGIGGAIQVARKNPGWSAAKIIDAVHNPGGQKAYERWHDEAAKIIRAYGGGLALQLDTYRKTFWFVRGKDENTWDAAGRLVDEVGWRRFMRGRGDDRRLWLISEADLMAQRPELVLREGDPGVDWLDFDLDEGSRTRVAELKAQVRAGRWTALPGMVVSVQDAGPASGRWLVAKVYRSLVDTSGAATVTLRKPIPEKPEPDAETAQRDTNSASGSSVDAAFKAARHVDSQNRPYKWGGGHGVSLDKIGPHDGLDCSSSVSLVLKRAGLFTGSTAIVSGDFARKWGKSGKGKHLTVWANDGHVFVEFHDRDKRFDTSPHGSGPSGPHVRPMNRSTAGFTPRHWPGT